VIRRRRVCVACNFRFTTFERVQLRELTVIKRNGRRVPFDRDKLVRSLQISLRKRPVDPERVEKMVSAIVRELESGGEAEISSEAIGEIVMEHLRQLDDVAYVRFASVYRNFREAGTSKPCSANSPATTPRGSPCYANDLPHPGRPVRAEIEGRQSRRSALYGVGAGARPAWARPNLAQSRRRCGRGQGRRHCGPRLDASRRPSPCGAGSAQACRRGRARRHALCDAGAMLAFRQIAACADAIIAAGIARVVSAIEDPNPEVAGQGHARLRAAGITVDIGLGTAEAARDHAGHFRCVRDKRPHVILKLAVSSDDRIAAAGHKPVAISGEAARARCICCARNAMPSWSGSARCFRTIRS